MAFNSVLFSWFLDANNNAWSGTTSNACNKNKEILTCTKFPNTVIRIRYAEFVPCSKNETECLQPLINQKPQLLKEIRQPCEGRSQCTVLMLSLTSDPCPGMRKYLNVPYKCEVKPSSYPGMNVNLNLYTN